jgi:regulator of telomere elongation helicase 1
LETATRQKAIILEPKSTSELPSAIADFHKYLNLQKSTGCILMGVCRGKISEGIDFAHHMCRAVSITGLPFAPYMDPKVKLKREYLDGIRAGQMAKPTGKVGSKATRCSWANHLEHAYPASSGILNKPTVL